MDIINKITHIIALCQLSDAGSYKYIEDYILQDFIGVFKVTKYSIDNDVSSNSDNAYSHILRRLIRLKQNIPFVLGISNDSDLICALETFEKYICHVDDFVINTSDKVAYFRIRNAIESNSIITCLENSDVITKYVRMYNIDKIVNS